MIKVLFFIHDLGQGGAEKVLVNLVNNMDREKFDITLISLFGGGVNEQFLSSDIKHKSIFKKAFPGNSHLMKLFSPAFLHKLFIKEIYDIEVSYLEGPSARIISGCPNKNTKLVSWIHCTQSTKKQIATGFRSFAELRNCIKKFNKIIFVSRDIEKIYKKILPNIKSEVLYNTNDSEYIINASKELPDNSFDSNEFNIISIGKVAKIKGFNRLANAHCRLKTDGYNIHTYIIGSGNNEYQSEITKTLKNFSDENSFTFLGFKKNPYKYLARANLFVCSSYSEGFSTAATEALILGIPVVTTEVAGMREMLGESNEYGIITENNEDALYCGIKSLLDDKSLLEHYKKQAQIRGKDFIVNKTVTAVENMLLNLE
ncbi:MAG: glycosyltransferase [Clostridiales bacterium]|nr:glycosyltransferase [Clostridiales bacterium]